MKIQLKTHGLCNNAKLLQKNPSNRIKTKIIIIIINGLSLLHIPYTAYRYLKHTSVLNVGGWFGGASVVWGSLCGLGEPLWFGGAPLLF